MKKIIRHRCQEMLARVAFAFLLLFVAPALAYGQVGSQTPQKPKWGDKVTITYNPKADGATYTFDDDVYAVANVRNEDHSETYTSGLMKRTGDVLTFDLQIPERAAWVVVYYLTLEKWDRQNNVIFMVHNREGKAARNANYNMMFLHNPMKVAEAQKCIQAELQAYPDNFFAYQFKWMTLGTPNAQGQVIGVSKEERTKTILDDLKAMEALGKGETVAYLYARFFAAFFMQQHQELRSTLLKMGDKHPQEALTAKCFEEYRKWQMLKQLTDEGSQEIFALEKKIALQYPSGKLARDWVTRFSGDLILKDPTFELLGKLAKQLAVDEDANPRGHYYLALSLLQQKGDASAIAASLNKATERLLRGNLRLYGDMGGIQESNMLSSAYRAKSRLLLDQGKVEEALEAITMAKRVAKEPMPSLFDMEGNIWERLNRWDKAEDAYLEAHRIGSKTVAASLKALYARRHGQDAGFDEYLAHKLNSGSAGEKAANTSAGGLSFSIKAPPAKPQAPPFTVTTLDGKTYDLESLRGKVLVLNFWFIGCAPCRVEIPSLNRLVQDFKGKDVVFLALALDPKVALESFLKKNPFDYQIVPQAEKITAQYEVNAYPAHLVIDRQGQLQYRFGGGSDKVDERLRPLIQNLLNRQ